MHPAQEVVRSVREGMLHNVPLCFEISGGTCLHASMASPLIVHISRLYDLRELQDRLVGKLGAAGSMPTHPWSCGDTDATGTVVLPLVFLDVLIYLLMVDIDPDVMNMFTQDYGLTAAELTRVTKI